MKGPKIIHDHPAAGLAEYIEAQRFEQMRAQRPTTGIMRGRADREWHAIIDGRLVDTFTGAGSKARAIQTAGSNAVVA